ncbi:MAG: capsular polysaccharide synthesis protein [Oscillospiraceae bacterium]|nr:capsular polysaccharide synthesis protein [Oscillospiraceae bacterium]
MRLIRIIGRVLESIPRFFQYRDEFNTQIAAWMCWAYVLPSRKGKCYMSGLQQYFQQELSEITSQYLMQPHTVSGCPPKILWCCWLSGEDTMPDLVRVCYQAMKQQAPEDVQTVLITEKNYSQYISIPEYIVAKYRSGIISAAHFSDILRFCLLSQYGGMWLDSTVFTSGPIPDDIFSRDYYTQKAADPSQYPNEPSRAQWCGFIWAGAPGNPLFCFLRDGLLAYWKKHNAVIDYIFFDYIILTAYHNLPYVKEMMDHQEPNNEHIWALWQLMGQKYDMGVCAEVFHKNIFHKLSYKGNLTAYTTGGELTTYGWLIGENYEN